jgi:hypothetical protein
MSNNSPANNEIKYDEGSSGGGDMNGPYEIHFSQQKRRRRRQQQQLSPSGNDNDGIRPIVTYSDVSLLYEGISVLCHDVDDNTFL